MVAQGLLAWQAGRLAVAWSALLEPEAVPHKVMQPSALLEVGCFADMAHKHQGRNERVEATVLAHVPCLRLLFLASKE